MRGSLAVPIFEPAREGPIAVMELVMMGEDVQAGPQIDSICHALQVSCFHKSIPFVSFDTLYQ